MIKFLLSLRDNQRKLMARAVALTEYSHIPAIAKAREEIKRQLLTQK